MQPTTSSSSVSASSSNAKNVVYKTTIVDGVEVPYPPDPPAFCTRQSVKQMKDDSVELTKNELHKLELRTRLPTNQLPTNQLPRVSSIDFNPDMHRIMCTYADKQQQLCNQICDINTRLQQKQDEFISAKDEHQQTLSDMKDELGHMEEINDGNEDEIKELHEKIHILQHNHAAYKNTNERYWKYQPVMVMLLLFVYTCFGFEMNRQLPFHPQRAYNEYMVALSEMFL